MPVLIRGIWSKVTALLLGVLLMGVVSVPFAAQAQLTNQSPAADEREPRQERLYDRQPEQPGSGVESLPSWAEPSTSGGQTGAKSKNAPPFGPPPPPSPPPQVPVDGGLIWLLIAGGGYGVHKLLGSPEERGFPGG